MRERLWFFGIFMCLTVFAWPARSFAGSMPVQGRVDEVSGKPIANAEVVVVRCERREGGAIALTELGKAQTSSAGAFRVDWPMEQTDLSYCYLRATAPGYGYSWTRLESFAAGQIRWLDEQRNVCSFTPRLTLLPECFLTGTVVDKQGKPITGVDVSVDRGRASLKTDARGRFAFDKLLPRSFESFHNIHWMAFTHSNYVAKYYEPGNGSDPHQLNPQRAVDLRIEMEQGAVVRGRVTDADSGRPATGFTVRAVIQKDRWTYAAGVPISADGTYEMRIAPGVAHIALIAPDEGQPAQAAELFPVLDFVPITASEAIASRVDLQVRRGVAMTGRVTLPDTAPAFVMSQLRVSIGEAQASTEPGATNRGKFVRVGPKGEFSCAGLRPGAYNIELHMAVSGGEATLVEQPLTVTDDRPLAEVQVAPSAEVLFPRLAPTLLGRVVLPDGKPAAFAQVVYVPAEDSKETFIFGAGPATTASANGEFSLSLAASKSPDCRLYVRDASGVYAALATVKASIRPTPFEVTLVEGGRAKGRVSDAAGKPVVGWTVVYNRQNAHWGGGGGGGRAEPMPRFAAAFTDTDGHYELTGLIPVPGIPTEIAVTLDQLISDTAMLPGRATEDRKSHLAPAVAVGKTVERLDFQVLPTGRLRDYQIIPVAPTPSKGVP